MKGWFSPCTQSWDNDTTRDLAASWYYNSELLTKCYIVLGRAALRLFRRADNYQLFLLGVPSICKKSLTSLYIDYPLFLNHWSASETRLTLARRATCCKVSMFVRCHGCRAASSYFPLWIMAKSVSTVSFLVRFGLWSLASWNFHNNRFTFGVPKRI